MGLSGLGNHGVLYHGLEVLGGGATLAGMVLGTIAVFVIEKQFIRAAVFALVGAVLTFFGLIHGESVGIAMEPSVATSYLMLSGFLVLISRFETANEESTAPGPGAVSETMADKIK